MLSLAKHTTGRDIKENSTSCYLQILFDPSAEEEGISSDLCIQQISLQTNVKFLVMKCFFVLFWFFLTFHHCRPVIIIRGGCTLAVRAAAADNHSAILIIGEE